MRSSLTSHSWRSGTAGIHTMQAGSRACILSTWPQTQACTHSRMCTQTTRAHTCTLRHACTDPYVHTPAHTDSSRSLLWFHMLYSLSHARPTPEHPGPGSRSRLILADIHKSNYVFITILELYRIMERAMGG